MERVFVCYSRKDESFVDQLAVDLKAAGVPTWRDKEDIPGHIKANTESWRDAVQEGLQLCTHMIVVVSPDSVNSAEVKAEWNYFLRHDKPVHPVFYRDCDMPYRLFALNWEDFRQTYNQPLSKLLDVLPRDKTITLPTELEAAVNSQYAGIRQGAVKDLAQLIQDNNPALAQLAWATLEKLADDNSA